MDKQFKLLGVFSVIFRILAIGFLFLMAVMVVAIIIAPHSKEDPSVWQLVSNTILQMSITSLVLYSIGEIIQILRVIKEQTRKP